jgi:uncharacterized protein
MEGLFMEFAYAVIDRFYTGFPELRNVLLKHSIQVKNKALQIAKNCRMELDLDVVANGALLHDIGIIRCYAPDIFCQGDLPYIAHGCAGSAMLRELGNEFESYARICERHTGSGLTAGEIISGNLPLPQIDLLPETTEEKLICLADKFFSKSGKMEEKPLTKIRRQMAKFGTPAAERFEELMAFFDLC